MSKDKGKRDGAPGDAETQPAAEFDPLASLDALQAKFDEFDEFDEFEARLRARTEELELELAALTERVDWLEKHLNLQAVLRTEQIIEALREDPRRAFVVASPFRAGSVSLAAGQVISSTGHNVEQLARAGVPLRLAA